VLSLSYAQLEELLNQSEVTRDLLRQIASRNEERKAAVLGAAS